MAEHTHLIESLRAGKPLNELKQIADSSLVGILGREAAYTGRRDDVGSRRSRRRASSLTKLEWGPMPMPPVPMPGVTE